MLKQVSGDFGQVCAFDWKPSQIPDQTGRTAVVTGASSGLGTVVAHALAQRGATVVMAVRDTRKGEDVRSKLAGGALAERLEVRKLDLIDLESVRQFADDLLAEHGSIDVLVNNAGIAYEPYRLSPQGVESTFATNFLGHFALTGLLFEALERGNEARVVSVGSHLYSRVKVTLPLDDPAREYSPAKAYIASKLANLVFAIELQRRLEAAASTIRSLAAHPGVAATPMQQQAKKAHERAFGRMMSLLVGRSAEAGAIPLLFAATAAEAPSGVFLGPSLKKWDFRVHADALQPPADDPALARRLWQAAERAAGAPFHSGSMGVANDAGIAQRP
jgi:NAD(P)-dependent dehydrogenase (short-subunit alcohol dehydrogenase family)